MKFDKYKVYEYSPVWCCDLFEEAISRGSGGFYVKGNKIRYEIFNSSDSAGKGDFFSENLVKYCPFCGEKIEDG